MSTIRTARRCAAAALLAEILAIGLVAAGPASDSALDPGLARQVDAVFESFDTPATPGCAVGVMRGGALVYARGYGQASVELGVPITPRTVFDLGSVSKQFTAMAVMLLVEDGALSLDDDVRKYLPEIPSYGRTVSVRQLLQHTSGLRDYTDLLALADYDLRDVTTVPQALGMVARQKAPNFPAGDRFQYNNTGFFLASVLVERVSGQPLAAFADARIFKPLGMASTRVAGSHSISVPRRATAYTGTKGGFEIQMSNWEQTGDGAVQTSVEDLARWVANFDTRVVGSDGLLRAMETPGTLASGDAIDYGLGQFVSTHRGLRRVYHGGSWAGFRAALWRWPAAKTSVMTLCNRSDATPMLAERVSEVVLAAEMSPAAADTPAPPASAGASVKDAARYAGVYWSPREGGIVRLDARDGGLWTFFGSGSLPLTPAGDGRFVLGEPLPFKVHYTFAPAADGHWTVERSIADRERATYEWRAAWTPSAADLRALAGTWWSEELDAEYVLQVDGDRLVRAPRRGDAEPLRPAFDGTFEWGGAVIRFAPDRSSFEVLTGGTAQGIRFQRR